MKTLARPALRSAVTSISTMAGVRIRALTERHPIKPTSLRCHSAWQLNLGRPPLIDAEDLFRQPGPPQPLGNLHVDPVGILDVQTGIVALQGSRTTLCQIARSGFPVETGYSDREVIHDAGRASAVHGDQHLGVDEANDSAGLVLANHREAEHLLVEIDGTLQVRDMNADVVDVR